MCIYVHIYSNGLFKFVIIREFEYFVNSVLNVVTPEITLHSFIECSNPKNETVFIIASLINTIVIDDENMSVHIVQYKYVDFHTCSQPLSTASSLWLLDAEHVV